MATESLAPVAAITNFILGVITIKTSNRGEADDTHRRFAALMIDWVFINSAVYHLAESILDYYPSGSFGQTSIDFGLNEFQGIVGYDTAVLMLFGFQATMNILMLVIALHLPHDIGKGNLWNAIIIAGIAIYVIIVPPIIILTGFKYAAFQNFIWAIVGLFWTHTYIRAIINEAQTGDEKYRSISKASAILLIAWIGHTMIWWLSAYTFLNNEWFVVILTTFEEPPSALWLIAVNLGWSIGAVTIVTLTICESYRAIKKGPSAISIIVFALAIIGFLNWIQDTILIDYYYNCLEGDCTGEYPAIIDLYNYLTGGILVYLIKPLLFVYLMVQFKLIDTSSEKNRNLMRMMVILVLLIVSSSLIELVQSLIPIPQMVTGTLLAIGVVFFVGWEEKITSKFVNQGNLDDLESIKGGGFNESMLRNTSFLMMFLIFYIVVVSMILAATGA